MSDDEITHITCEVCGKETPLEEAYATLHENGRRIVHSCSAQECLDKAGKLPEAES